MRGPNHEQDYIFSYQSPADRVPSDHPLRLIKGMHSTFSKNRDRESLFSGGIENRPKQQIVVQLLLDPVH